MHPYNAADCFLTEWTEICFPCHDNVRVSICPLDISGDQEACPAFLLPCLSRAWAASRTVRRAAVSSTRHFAKADANAPCCATALPNAFLSKALFPINSTALSPIPARIISTHTLPQLKTSLQFCNIAIVNARQESDLEIDLPSFVRHRIMMSGSCPQESFWQQIYSSSLSACFDDND